MAVFILVLYFVVAGLVGGVAYRFGFCSRSKSRFTRNCADIEAVLAAALWPVALFVYPTIVLGVFVARLPGMRKSKEQAE